MTTPRPPRARAGTRLALCAAFMISALPILAGCGSDDPQILVIDLEPWGLDFRTETDASSDPRHFMYLAERYFMTVLRFELTGGRYDPLDATSPPAAGGFSPYTVHVAKGASSHVLFVTDTTRDAQRLLALDPDFSEETGHLDAILLAETPGPEAQERFTDLHGVAALAIDDDTYRVFLADDSTVWIMDYGLTERSFSYGSPVYPEIHGGCERTFQSPVGLAVDGAADAASGLPALYVADKGGDALFRFSSIGGANPVPACDGLLEEWAGAPRFVEPRGVAVRPGATDPLDALVMVADRREDPSVPGNARVSAFSWRPVTSSFQPEPLPLGFEFVPNAAPFGLAFDERGDLWATYPEAKAIAGPSR